MAFGQQAGPRASRREVRELLTLLRDAGHTDFRDARRPMGFTQRQAAGKFTRDEAAAFIAQLQDTESSGEPAAPRPPNPRMSAAEQVLRRMPAEQLAAELQRRRWVVVQPWAAFAGAVSQSLPSPQPTSRPVVECAGIVSRRASNVVQARVPPLTQPSVAGFRYINRPPSNAG
jgi:hypothetical protein